MTLLRRIDTVWTGLAGTPGLTSLWFKHQAGSAVPAATAVDTFWKANTGRMCIGLTGQVQDDQRIYESTTGQVVAMEQGGAPAPISASASGEPLPLFTQGLLRLKTGVFIEGRRLQGRIFIPAPPETENTFNKPTTVYTGVFNSAAATLKTSSVTFGAWEVYSRVHKVEGEVSSALMWGQWAVLRSRR